jgi:hypothetical protein
MKKIINAIRDFLYNITDYGLIIIVIVVMVGILGWRFNILFSRGIDKEVIDQLPPIAANEPEPSDSTGNNPNPSEPGEAEEPSQTEEPEKPSQNESGSGLIATVVIPDGTLPSKIAEILLNSNLIDDTKAFLNKSVELGLDTRLRSGTYEIEVGTSLDNIIKILANAQ